MTRQFSTLFGKPFQKTVLALMVSGVVLTGCGDKASQSAGASKTASTTHLNMAMAAEPQSLDPQRAGETGSFDLARQMFVGLTSSDKSGKTIPSAAESWQSEDNKTWTFKLRSDMKWSNGDPLNAHDFVYALRRLVDPNLAADYGSYLADARVINAEAIFAGKMPLDQLGVKALDDTTLEIRLSEPVPYLPELLSLPPTYAIPQKAIEAHGEKWTDPANIVVSGAYTLKEKVINGHIKLERNPSYYDHDKVAIESVTFLIVTDTAAQLNRYESGELDITTGVPADQFAKVKQEHGSELHVYPQQCTAFYEFNTIKAPFTDPRVRQAVSMMIDRDIITGQVTGRGEVPTYQFTPVSIQGMNEHKPDWTKLDKSGRLEQAKTLLTQAGYSATNPLKFELLYSTSELAKRITTATASMFKESGMVDVSLVNQEWKTSLDTRNQGKFDAAFAAWCSDYNEPSSFLNVYKSGSTHNKAKYASPAFDKALTQALAATDDTARLGAYAEAEKILSTDYPLATIYSMILPRLIRSNISAESLSDPAGNWQIKDWTIK